MVDMINYEIEYVMRPVSAPIRSNNGGPRLRTNRRARSSRPDQRGGGHSNGRGHHGYPRVGVTRSHSDHAMVRPASSGQGTMGQGVMVRPASSGALLPPQDRDQGVIERPRTAPHRSPTRPHYKEEVYNQSKVVLRYVGHPDHRARDRNYNIGRHGRAEPMPAYLDEVGDRQ